MGLKTMILILLFFIHNEITCTSILDWKLFKVGNTNLLLYRSSWVAQASFQDSINKTGFSYLELQTNPDLTDEQQAYGAGYLEGAITHYLIRSHWFNVVNIYCESNKENCTKINNFIDQNTEWILTNIKNNPSDSYWHHVSLFYTQIKGLLDGYNIGIRDEELKLTWHDMVWLNIFADVEDLKEILGFREQDIGDGHCSVLIKILPGNNDVYFGHNTWSAYQSMLRMQKNYVLSYRQHPDGTDKIPGIRTTFTSYPASISSIDDFYLVSSGLAVTETTNVVFNKTLYNNFSPKNIVWESIRSVIANRLATDGETWSKTFEKYNSGTYNNQWMVFDYKKFQSGQPPEKNAFWVLEQVPSKVISKDLTNVLIQKGYWSSYNIPYYKEIYEITDYTSMFKKYGKWFSHDDAPRAKIFERDQTKINDMQSFMKLMRSNDFENDPLAKCECNPPYSSAGAIAARNDLNPANGTYPFKGLGHRPTGAIDAKITNSNLFKELQFIAVSGPTTGTDGKLPAFKWSTSNFNKIPRLSHPDTWNFQPVLYKWSLPTI